MTRPEERGPPWPTQRPAPRYRAAIERIAGIGTTLAYTISYPSGAEEFAVEIVPPDTEKVLAGLERIAGQVHRRPPPQSAPDSGPRPSVRLAGAGMTVGEARYRFWAALSRITGVQILSTDANSLGPVEIVAVWVPTRDSKQFLVAVEEAAATQPSGVTEQATLGAWA